MEIDVDPIHNFHTNDNESRCKTKSETKQEQKQQNRRKEMKREQKKGDTKINERRFGLFSILCVILGCLHIGTSRETTHTYAGMRMRVYLPHHNEFCRICNYAVCECFLFLFCVSIVDGVFVALEK